MQRLLAVDGNSLGHRSWHALKSERLDGPWVTHGFVRMLGTAWRHGPFDAVIVAFDSRSSIRKERCPEYKANREEHDPQLYEQFARLEELLRTCGFTAMRAQGYEADDLLAATARAACVAGIACTVLSSDRDLIALVDETVTLLRPRQSMSDITVYDPAAVRDEFGVEPAQYLHLAALRGDPSDGLDGVRGIGPKTAARLIASWGSVQSLYEDVRHLPPKLARKLRRGREKVERNVELMTPLGDHDVDVAGALAAGVDVPRVIRILTEVGLHEAASSFQAAVERGPMPPPAPAPPEDTTDYGRAADVGPPRQPHEPVVVTGRQVSLFD